MRRILAAALGLTSIVGVAASATAHPSEPTVHIGDAWATAPIGAAKNGGAFMTLYNIGEGDAELTGAASASAKRVELHRSSMEDGVMRMAPVDRLRIPAHGHTALRPGGYHVMLIGAGGLEVGDTLELTLQFAQLPDQTLTVPVVQTGTTPKAVRQQVLVPMHQITADGQQARIGTLALRAHPGGLLAVPLLQGLQPGPHAMHLHTQGDCGSTERDGELRPGAAAGGHFDPDETGRYDGPYRNGARGDMPNLYVEDNGTSTIPVLAPRLNLEDVRGRSIMIHAEPDRYGPRLPGASVLNGGGRPSDHGHGDTQDHEHHGGLRMYCGIVPDA
ncbi:copper chaperone PCu(A)C [Rhodovibrio salinarum]|nr:copper chaperone PCu(A)C [Rhodovibrio salinarum]